MEPSVGLIGLGLLGSAMASRLSAAGFRVIGLDPKWSEGLAIDRAASPSEVFERSDRVLLSLPTSAIAQEVLAQAEPALRSNHLVIDTTTGAPDEMVAMARGLRARDADYLEANVAGSSAGMRRPSPRRQPDRARSPHATSLARSQQHSDSKHGGTVSGSPPRRLRAARRINSRPNIPVTWRVESMKSCCLH